jgi:molybdate transport system permease protein
MTLTDAEFQALRLSLLVSGRAALLSLPFAIACAWLLERRRFPGRMLFDGLVHLPLVVPPVVVGYLLLVLFGTQGIVGKPLLEWFGIKLAFTAAGASLAIAVTTFPLMVRAIRLSIASIDVGLEDAARTLGARPLDRFATITLPLMLPGILAGTVLAFSAGLGEFGAVITFVSNIPGETQTLPLAIYTATQTPGGEGAAARLAALSIALALAGLLLSEILSRRVRAMLVG